MPVSSKESGEDDHRLHLMITSPCPRGPDAAVQQETTQVPACLRMGLGHFQRRTSEQCVQRNAERTNTLVTDKQS